MPSLLLHFSFLFVLSLVSCRSNATTLTRVLLPDAVQKGAVCLDGSPPGYYIHHGTTAPNKWVIFLSGGGWCTTLDECDERSRGFFGSSKYFPEVLEFSGLLTDNCTINPHFCGWTIVFVAYCDGASFAGNLDTPVNWNGTTLYFRGFRILEAVIDALLVNGVNDAEEVLLTGCSAGGLAVYFFADYVRSKIPSNIPLYAMADAGYFPDVRNVDGELHIRKLFQNVFEMQNCMGAMDKECIAKYTGTGEEWKCFMSQYTYPFVRTPTFLLNSHFDTVQLDIIFQLDCLPPNCTMRQMWEFQYFGDEFLEAAHPAIWSRTNGVFIDSCLQHCHSVYTDPWSKIVVDGQTISDTLYGWMTNDPSYKIKRVDRGLYPSNPTCDLQKGMIN